MSLTTIAELRAALGVGSLYADATLQEVCDAADDVLSPFLWQNHLFNTSHGISDNVATLFFDEDITDTFYVGQSIIVTKNTATFNGTKTITAVGNKSISYALVSADQAVHTVAPTGQVAASTTDYSTYPAIQEAALMISIDIWQSRQAPSSGGVTIDGYAPSPYRMGNTLLARVRGLLAPYLDPRSMVG